MQFRHCLSPLRRCKHQSRIFAYKHVTYICCFSRLISATFQCPKTTYNVIVINDNYCSLLPYDRELVRIIIYVNVCNCIGLIQLYTYTISHTIGCSVNLNGVPRIMINKRGFVATCVKLLIC